MPLASCIQGRPSPPLPLPPRSDRTVRAIARAWRRLTGGTSRGGDRARRTLIACSGGGDSSGLVLALAAAAPSGREVLVVGHIVHDLRREADAFADRDATKALATGLRLPFVEARVYPRRQGGNSEAAARELRYRGLSDLARQAGCPFVATAHHAQDQLETMIMGLLRGAGPRGLAGVAPRRRLSAVTLIRPTLGVSGTDLRRLCRKAGWTWREDGTNSDQSRLRSAVRAQVVPVLESLRPGSAERAARAGRLLRGTAQVLEDAAARLLNTAKTTAEPAGWCWDRTVLRGQRPVVLGALLRRAAASLADGRGADRRSARAIEPAIAAIMDRSGELRTFQWGGVELRVSRDTVQLAVRHAAAASSTLGP